MMGGVLHVPWGRVFKEAALVEPFDVGGVSNLRARRCAEFLAPEELGLEAPDLHLIARITGN